MVNISGHGEPCNRQAGPAAAPVGDAALALARERQEAFVAALSARVYVFSNSELERILF